MSERGDEKEPWERLHGDARAEYLAAMQAHKDAVWLFRRILYAFILFSAGGVLGLLSCGCS